MIQLHTFDAEKNIFPVFKKYLFMLDKVLPFLQDDISAMIMTICEPYIDQQEAKLLADSIHQAEHKRNKGKTRYEKLLIEYSVPEMRDKHEEDALLAKRIIQDEMPSLYEFLYDGEEGNDNAHVKIDSLTKLIISPPQELVEIIGEYSSKMDEQNDQTQNRESLKTKTKENRTLNLIFRYEYMTSSNDMKTYEYMKSLNIKVCPYCNRNYIFTVSRNKKGDFQVRPELDHYFIKSKYPYLAVNLRNLIPSCHTCNHSKGEFEKQHLYPYAEGMGNEAYFRTRPVGSLNYITGEENAIDNFSLEIELNTTRDQKNRIKNSITAFGLEELYNQHKDLILQLYRKRYIYNNDFLYMLRSCDERLGLKEEEWKKMMGIADISEEAWGEVPLGKLTSDIIKEIEDLYR